MSQDPYPSDRQSGSNPDPYGAGTYGRQGGYQPYQPGLYSSYQPGMYAPPARTMEGERAAQLSLIFGIVGLFVAGLILGPLAIWQAKKAESFGVPATAGKVLGWILVAMWGLAALLVILLVVFLFAGIATTGSNSV